MAVKEPQPTLEPVKPELPDNLKTYDNFMVTVNRTTTKKGATVTKSVEIGKCLLRNIRIGEESMTLQNNLQDWQNKTGAGQNIVQWLFPAGSVKSGLEYAAKEQFAKDADGDETGHKVLVIDTNSVITN